MYKQIFSVYQFVITVCAIISILPPALIVIVQILINISSDSKDKVLPGLQEPPTQYLTYQVYIKDTVATGKGKVTAKKKAPKETEWMEVELPPAFRTLQKRVLDTIVTTPLEFDVQCHSQATEHGVALTTESVGKRKNHKSQLGVAFSTDVVRKKYNSKITHKSYG